MARQGTSRSRSASTWRWGRGPWWRRQRSAHACRSAVTASLWVTAVAIARERCARDAHAMCTLPALACHCRRRHAVSYHLNIARLAPCCAYSRARDASCVTAAAFRTAPCSRPTLWSPRLPCSAALLVCSFANCPNARRSCFKKRRQMHSKDSSPGRKLRKSVIMLACIMT